MNVIYCERLPSRRGLEILHAEILSERDTYQIRVLTMPVGATRI